MKKLLIFQTVSTLAVFAFVIILLTALNLPMAWAATMLWQDNWLALAEALALFMLAPLGFVTFVALDRRRG